MDSSILKKCITGDSKAQRQLYEQYAPQMYAVCFRYAADEAMAEEIMHEGFIQMYQNLESFRFEGSFEGWVKRIMVNVSLGYLRKNKKHQHFSIDENFREEGGQYPTILDSISIKEIMYAIADLADGYREVVNLYIIDGYSHREIAALLEISEDNSKQRLRRGRLLLQKKLKAMYHIPNESVSGT